MTRQLALLAVVGAMSCAPTAPVAAPAVPDVELVYGPGARLVPSNEDVRFELTTAALQLDVVETEAGPWSVPKVGDLPRLGITGEPSLPRAHVVLRLSGHWSALEIRSIQSEPQVSDMPHPPQPVPQWVPNVSKEIYEAVDAKPDPDVYEGGGFWPSTPVRVARLVPHGDDTLAVIELSPLQVDVAAHQLEHHRHLLVALQATPATVETQSNAVGRDPFELPDVEQSAGNAVKVIVHEAGIQRIHATDLQAASFPAGDPRRLALRRDGVTVPIRVVGESDGVLDPGEFIEFYAPRVRSRYSDDDVYWLLVDQDDPARMPIQNADPPGPPVASGSALAISVLDRPRTAFNVSILNGEADNFFLAAVNTLNPVPTLTLEAPDPVTTAGDATLAVDLWGLSSFDAVDPDHQYEVRFNGNLLPGLIEFDGQTSTYAVLDVPAALLAAGGANTVELTPTGNTGASFDAIYVDALTLTYPHGEVVTDDAVELTLTAGGLYTVRGFASTRDLSILDITDPFAPVWQAPAAAILPVQSDPEAPGPGDLQTPDINIQAGASLVGHRIAVASAAGVHTPTLVPTLTTPTLSDPSNAADYVVVTHDDFLSAAAELAAAREEQGMRTRVVSIDDVYDQFAFGRHLPDALRSFIAATQSWSVPPRWFVLLGDGSFDYKRAIPPVDVYDNRTFIPVRLYDSPFFETATDNWFADVQGNDLYPDVYLGRLPVESVEEAHAVVNKILDYERRDYAGNFEERFLIVADDITETWETIFTAYGDELGGSLPLFVQPTKVYLGSPAYPTASSASSAITSTWNQGVLGVNYFGHGSRDVWADEDIFDTTQMAALGNTQRPAFVVVMNCLNGVFQFPNEGGAGRSLGESVLLADGGGVGFAGTTSLAYAEPQVIMDRAFWDIALAADPVTVGEAFTLSKVLLANDVAAERDVIESWVLLGDPAMTLRVNHRPQASVTGGGSVQTGQTLHLDASASSDPDVGQALDFQWTLENQPTGGDVTLAANGAALAATPRVAGAYTIRLVVSDGLYSSEPIDVVIQAAGPTIARDGPGFCECRMTRAGAPAQPKTGGVLLGLLSALALVSYCFGSGNRRRR